jgi:hypothetical protein
MNMDGVRNKDDDVNYHTDQRLNKLRKFHALLNGELPMLDITVLMQIDYEKDDE